MTSRRDNRGSGKPAAVESDELALPDLEERDPAEITDPNQALELDASDLELDPPSSSSSVSQSASVGASSASFDSAVLRAPVFVVPPTPKITPAAASKQASASSRSGSQSHSRSSAPDEWLGKLVAGRYQIERELAAGGMGRVYVATQQPLGRSVAIKVVRTEVSGSRQQFLRRFFLEAASCAKLTHPNIVTIHDYGETDDGEVFMAMEFLDGRSLDKDIKDTAPMQAERALHIAIQVSRALREAHGKGIIHRDLKPQNIMLVDQGDEQDFVKVLDFGLVKMLTNDPSAANEGHELTRAGVLLGSPNYMSPEQILGGPIDGRTDIYSLGIVLFKMLAGKNPFARDSEMDVIYKHVNMAPPTFASMGVAVHPATEAVVMQCLAKQPKDRFADCKDLVIALKDARKEALGQAHKDKKKKKKRDIVDPAESAAEAPVVIIPAAPEPVVPPPPAVTAPVEFAKIHVKQVPASTLNPTADEPARSRASVAPLKPVISTTTIPNRLYLRARAGGAAIGPVGLPQLEVLYSSRVLDDATPISSDGIGFEELVRWSKLRDHLGEFRQKVVDGGRPWERTSIAPGSDGAGSVTGVLFRNAAEQVTGSLTLPRDGGVIRLSYVDGKIVEVFTDAPDITLQQWLVDKSVLTRATLDDKLPIPPQRSGDLGDALIAAMLVPPHIFMEKIVEWAKWVISGALELPARTGRFEPLMPDAPQIPLSFDRFGVLIDAVRAAPDRGLVVRTIEEAAPRIAIPSSARGASVEDLKLAPRELRLLRGVDGTKTIGEILAAAKNDAPLVKRTLYLGLEVGLVVLGEDLNAPKDRAEAARLHGILAKLKEKTPFEALNVQETANDDEVRARYMDMVKLYHPDHARQGAAPELQEAMRALFQFAQDAFAMIETAPQREKIKTMREMGFSGKENEQDVVRRVLEAEIAFKKAKTFVKLKKFDDALQMMRDAVTKKPKDMELKIHLRYYEMLGDKGDRSALVPGTIEDIKKLLKQTDGDIASAHLILGHLYKLLGQDESAIKAFKMVLKYDERNHEAESEIRLMQMREQKKAQKRGSIVGGIVRGLGGSKDK